MRKYWVVELSEESKALFRNLAKEHGLNEEEIQDGLNSKIGDLDENEYLFGFRHCDNIQCKEFFNKGYMTEDSFTFCSSECAEKTVKEIEEKDYGEYIFFTDWEPELTY